MRGLEEAAAPAVRCLLEACVDVEVILVRSCRRPVYFVWGITNNIYMVVLECLQRPGLSRPNSARRKEGVSVTWEKQVLSARGFKRVGRYSTYAI
jgi:hypothetical protein